MVGVRVRYGVQAIEEEPHARSDVEIVLVAVPVNVTALNILKYEKRLTSE